MGSLQTPISGGKSVVLYLSVGASLGGGIGVVDRLVERALSERPGVRYLPVRLFDDPTELEGRLGPSRRIKLRFLIRLMRAAFAAGPKATILCGHVSLSRSIPAFISRRRRFVLFAYGNEIRPRHRTDFGSADIILAISRHSMGLVAGLCDHPRIRVIPLTLDPKKEPAFLADKQAERAGHPVVLIVSRLGTGTEGKGHSDLIVAMSMVRSAHPTCELWIAGSGDGREKLEELAEEVAPGAVRFLGFVPDEDLAKLYDACWIFAMPSRQEGFGLVYIEAMARSRACVASSADAGGEVVADGVSGVVVPYGDPKRLADGIQQLIANPATAERLGSSGRRRLDTHFSGRAFESALDASLWSDPVGEGPKNQENRPEKITSERSTGVGRWQPSQ